MVGTIEAKMICKGCPKGMTLSCFGVLIPPNKELENLGLIKREFHYYHYLFDRTVNGVINNFSSHNGLIMYAEIKINFCLIEYIQIYNHYWLPGGGRRNDSVYSNSSACSHQILGTTIEIAHFLNTHQIL